MPEGQEGAQPTIQETSLKTLSSRLHAKVDEEVGVLTQIAHAGYISPAQIAAIPLNNLTEIASRVRINETDGSLYFPWTAGINLAGPTPVLNPLEKFKSMAGLTSPTERRNLNKDILSEAAIEAMNQYNSNEWTQRNKAARAIAIVFSGSHFQPGKTPSLHSDLDLDIVYDREGAETSDQYSICDINLARALGKYYPGLVLDPKHQGISEYLEDIKHEIRRAAQIAVPYRESSQEFNHTIPTSFVVAFLPENPQIQELLKLIPKLPPHLSQYPSYFMHPPTTKQWEQVKFDLTSEEIAQRVANSLTPASN